MRQAALLLFVAISLAGAERWRIQFPRDQKRSDFSINDLKFASPTSGVAVGQLGQGRKRKPVALVTGDSGDTWSFLNTKEVGLSLFFLNERAGWMLTAGCLWKTVDSGRHWTKLAAGLVADGALAVYFLDENRGWVAGRHKSVYSTSDGGKHWSLVGAAEAVDSNPVYTSYNWIAFANSRAGMITGDSLPPQPGPERPRQELPHLTIFLDTRDGGESWKASTVSMFGRVTKVLFRADGQGLGLIEFQAGFEYPSEVFRIDAKTGKSWRVFRRANCAVTDIALTAAGTAYLAAVEPRGGKRPGKLKLFESQDLETWSEVEVDDRATARRAKLAAADATHAWLATDTGLILRQSSE